MITFLGGGEDVQSVERENHERRGEFVAKQPELRLVVRIKLKKMTASSKIEFRDPMTHMHGVVLVQLWCFLDFAHHDDKRRSASEEALLGPEVILPRSRKVRDALLEELVVELDVGHLG